MTDGKLSLLFARRARLRGTTPGPGSSMSCRAKKRQRREKDSPTVTAVRHPAHATIKPARKGSSEITRSLAGFRSRDFPARTTERARRKIKAATFDAAENDTAVTPPLISQPGNKIIRVFGDRSSGARRGAAAPSVQTATVTSYFTIMDRHA